MVKELKTLLYTNIVLEETGFLSRGMGEGGHSPRPLKETLKVRSHLKKAAGFSMVAA